MGYTREYPQCTRCHVMLGIYAGLRQLCAACITEVQAEAMGNKPIYTRTPGYRALDTRPEPDPIWAEFDAEMSEEYDGEGGDVE